MSGRVSPKHTICTSVATSNILVRGYRVDGIPTYGGNGRAITAGDIDLVVSRYSEDATLKLTPKVREHVPAAVRG